MSDVMSVDAAATQAAVYSAPQAQAMQAGEEQAVQESEPSPQAYTTTAPLTPYQGTTVDVYA